MMNKSTPPIRCDRIGAQNQGWTKPTVDFDALQHFAVVDDMIAQPALLSSYSQAVKQPTVS